MLFIQNKYTQWYYTLIEKARNRVIEDYTESHHIIPKSLGGSNAKDNKVRLTAREHYIAHLLLVKMVTNNNKNKMSWALHQMTFSKNKHHRRNFSSYQYELARKIHAYNMKENGRNQFITGQTWEERWGKERANKNKQKRSIDLKTIRHTYNCKQPPHVTEQKRQMMFANNPMNDIDLRLKAANHHAQDWKITNPQGKIFVVHNLSQFCRENNLGQGCMINVAKGKYGYKSHKGWKCKKLSVTKMPF